jgi:hypothetical protein
VLRYTALCILYREYENEIFIAQVKPGEYNVIFSAAGFNVILPDTVHYISPYDGSLVEI